MEPDAGIRTDPMPLYLSLNLAVCYMCVDPSRPFDKYTEDKLDKRSVSGTVERRQLNSGLLFMRGGIPKIVDVTVKWLYLMLDVRAPRFVVHRVARMRHAAAVACCGIDCL